MGGGLRRASAVLAAALLLPAAALAHAKGVHKRVTLVVAKHETQGVVVVDFDSGERCAVLRSAADADHDGLLDDEEARALRDRLVGLALRTLKLSFSTQPVRLETVKTKLSLREDRRANDAGLSVAVMVGAKYRYTLTPGLKVQVDDVSPDGSKVALDVFQAPPKKGEAALPFHGEIEPGTPVEVRLGALGDAPPAVLPGPPDAGR